MNIEDEFISLLEKKDTEILRLDHLIEQSKLKEEEKQNFPKFAPHALKGQKLLAQGIALGKYGRKPVAL